MNNKPISITTTIRNPNRLKVFLMCAKELEGESWSNKDIQEKYQILLIKNRLFGFGQSQFYGGLEGKYINLIEDVEKEISFDVAKEIFKSKNYIDPAMRGRTSMNPLIKFGFVSKRNDILKITDLGNLLLNKNNDLGEILLKALIKWQLPNPSTNGYKKIAGYDVKPCITTLHLINLVNKKEKENKEKEKGISRDEFITFIPTLINYEDIEIYADELIKLRNEIKKDFKNKEKILKTHRRVFCRKSLRIIDERELDTTLKNLKEYADNLIRYFNTTGYFYIRGNGYFIDLSKERRLEINALLSMDDGSSKNFISLDDYEEYICDIQQPLLPWEKDNILIEIQTNLLKDINALKEDLGVAVKEFKLNTENITEMKESIKKLREEKHELLDEKLYKDAQKTSVIEECIQVLENIEKIEQHRPIILEKYISIGLRALNDAIKIHPNYPTGDDNEPTCTAPANVPDIECFYRDFNLICEATMLKDRSQWFNEGQPVMRHLRDFEDKYEGKNTYCLFVAPLNHRDTLNTFWNSICYAYEGEKQKILPINLKNFINILKILLNTKKRKGIMTSEDLELLYKKILDDTKTKDNAIDWEKEISKTINTWGEDVLKKN